MILLVAYDLHDPGRSYKGVATVLESAQSAVHPQGSVWLIESNVGPKVWLDSLRDAGDVNDEFFVVRLQRNWHSIRMDKAATDWLHAAERSW